MSAENEYVEDAPHAMQPMSAYGVVHYLLRELKGSASKHWCVECAQPAQHWAYGHCDVFERIDMETGRVFSVNFDHYQPMCARCHQRLDAANAPRIQAALERLRAIRAGAA